MEAGRRRARRRPSEATVVQTSGTAQDQHGGRCLCGRNAADPAWPEVTQRVSGPAERKPPCPVISKLPSLLPQPPPGLAGSSGSRSPCHQPCLKDFILPHFWALRGGGAWGQKQAGPRHGNPSYPGAVQDSPWQRPRRAQGWTRVGPARCPKAPV